MAGETEQAEQEVLEGTEEPGGGSESAIDEASAPAADGVDESEASGEAPDETDAEAGAVGEAGPGGQEEPTGVEAAGDEGGAAPGPHRDPRQEQNVKHILAMQVPLIVRIAQKKLRIAEVLKFNLGSVIHFDQDAYQHVDLMVNNEVIGLGQPVKIGENFGLKITQIGDLSDTIKRLGGSE